MAGKLFLGGGGSEKESEDIDRLFYQTLKNKNLLYIPLARNINDFKACTEWIKKVFSKFGEINITTEKSFEELAKIRMESYDGIYIGGGNTFHLLNGLRKHHIIPKLKKFYEGGGNIYGGSAGAIIMGVSVSLAKLTDTNEVQLNNLNGLNIIKNTLICCHFSSKLLPEIMMIAKKKKIYRILAIPETSGVIFEEGLIKVKGKQDVLFIFDSKIGNLPPGSALINFKEIKNIIERI